MNRRISEDNRKSHQKNLSCCNLRLKLRTNSAIILFMLTVNIPKTPHSNHQKNIVKNIFSFYRMRKLKKFTAVFNGISIKTLTGKRPCNMVKTNAENNGRSVVFLKCQIKRTKVFLILKCRIMRVMSTTLLSPQSSLSIHSPLSTSQSRTSRR